MFSKRRDPGDTEREKNCYWRFGKPISTQQQNSRFVVRREEERRRGEDLKHVRLLCSLYGKELNCCLKYRYSNQSEV